MAAPPPSLSNILPGEAACLAQFLALLEQEKSALVEGNIDRLAPISEEKEALARQLSAAAQIRNAALDTLGLPPDRPGVDAWLARNPRDHNARSTWQTTLGLASKAKALTAVIGELIALRMQHNSEALAVLQRKDSPLDLYGPDGHTAPNNGRRISDSV